MKSCQIYYYQWIFMLSLGFLSGKLYGQVSLVTETKISDNGLYFNGDKVPNEQRLTYPNRSGYDYAFGRRITPHGDCIDRYGDYIFLTWYKGGESQRNVMLTRYNMNTGSKVTIEFPHKHTGFQNRPHIGESHNTIAVGVCQKDGSIHLLYDMHAYSPTRPENGSLANDYFRYQYSVDNAASLPDNQFTLDKFYNKQLYLKQGENYRSLTYPNFFNNANGDLLVVMREGGHNNSKYKFAKFNGSSWTTWSNFNELNAKNRGVPYNWGLYGDIKYVHGKMRIGFHTRLSNNSDKYELNNGFYYAYSNDQNGITDWFDFEGNAIPTPLIDYRDVKISEPGNVVNASGANAVKINRGADWIVTENEDIHFITEVIVGGNKTPVHTYKKASDNNFTTKTNFPGGSLYSAGGDVYLLNLEGGRPVIYKAEGGTNNWTELYRATSGKTFRHGNALISDGKLYYYLMQVGSGDKQPIWLQVYDLDIDDLEGTYFIKNVATGTYLDSDGTNLKVGPNNGASDKKWRLVKASEGYYNIDSDFSGRGVLETLDNKIVRGTSTQPVANADNREWLVESLGNNTYRFKSRRSGHNYLAAITSNSKIEWTGWTGNRAQWVLESTSGSRFTAADNEIPENVMNVFPNPIDSYFSVNIGDNESAQVLLYNLSGKLIVEKMVTQDNNRIERNDQIQSGLYFLTIKTIDGVNYTYKLFFE